MPRLEPALYDAIRACVREFLLAHRGEWFGTKEVCAALDMNMQRASRALMDMAEDGEISERCHEFQDYKWRPRTRLLYRFEPCSSVGVELAALFGIVVHQPTGGRIVRGKAFIDDEDRPPPMVRPLTKRAQPA